MAAMGASGTCHHRPVTIRPHDRGSLLLQVAIATTAATAGVAAVAASASPVMTTAQAWACEASRSAIEAALLAHLAATGRPAASLAELAGGDRPALVFPPGATLGTDGRSMTVNDWTVELDDSNTTPAVLCVSPPPVA